jgi:hypothetical protein
MYLKKFLTEKATDAARIALSVRDRKWSSDPVCDFCADPKPIVIYASSRSSTGENGQVWRWTACETCEKLIDIDQWSAIQDRMMLVLRRRASMRDTPAPLLRQAVMHTLAEFHRYAVRRKALKLDFTEDEIRRTYEEMERRYPDLWRVCYPRHYSENPRCGDYYSPKSPARQMAAIALKMMRGTVGRSEQYEFLAASQLARFNVPMYWLSRDIAEAIRLTTPPNALDWYTMPLPFEAAVFMMPKGSMRHPTEGDVEFISYARFPALERQISRLVPGQPYSLINGGLIMLALTQAGHLIHWNMPLDAFGSQINLPDADELVMRFSDDSHESGWFWQPDMTPDDNGLIVDLIHYIFGTLLLMTTRPDIVTLGARQKRVIAKASNAVKEFWTPSVIGKDYVLRRLPTPYQGGHHASPRYHWVKGFYRNTPVGPRKLGQTRRDFIDPYQRGL